MFFHEYMTFWWLCRLWCPNGWLGLKYHVTYYRLMKPRQLADLFHRRSLLWFFMYIYTAFSWFDRISPNQANWQVYQTEVASYDFSRIWHFRGYIAYRLLRNQANWQIYFTEVASYVLSWIASVNGSFTDILYTDFDWTKPAGVASASVHKSVLIKS